MRQKLGQHFLINTVKLREIAEALQIKEGDEIIEVGPGHGELTEAILEENKKISLTVVEKDPELAAALRTQYEKEKNISVIEGDIRELLPDVVGKSKKYKLAGNIPYYLTNYLFRLIGDLPHKPSLSVFMIQKEVAERISAQKGEMSLLSASVQAWADAEITTYVSKNDFLPPPEVESAVIRLTTREKVPQKELAAYYAATKIIFKQQRKTILNNLSTDKTIPREEWEKMLEKIGIDPKNRPADLEVADIIAIARLIHP